MGESKEDLKNIVQLVQELIGVQADLAKVSSQIAIRAGERQVDQKVEELRTYIEAQAMRFSAKIEKMQLDYLTPEFIGAKYSISYENVDAIFSQEAKSVWARKTELEAEEQKNILAQAENKEKMKTAQRIISDIMKAKETGDLDTFAEKGEELNQLVESEITIIKENIMKAQKTGDLEALQKAGEELRKLKSNDLIKVYRSRDIAFQTRREKLREAIEACERKYNEVLEMRKAKLDEITEEKERRLARVPTQTGLQKFFSSIFIKIGGTQKFIDNVMIPLNDNAERIVREHIPKIQEDVREDTEFFKDGIEATCEEIERLVSRVTIDGLEDDLLQRSEENVERFMGIFSRGDEGVEQESPDIAQILREEAKGSGMSLETSDVRIPSDGTFGNINAAANETKRNIIQPYISEPETESVSQEREYI